MSDADAKTVQRVGEPKGIGVLPIGGEKFGTDRNDLRIHLQMFYAMKRGGASESVGQELAVERKSGDVPVDGVQRVVGGDHRAAGGQKREADDVAAAEDQFGFSLWRDANDSTFAGERTGHVKIAATIKREALRAAEAAEKRGDFARGINAIHAVEAGGCGAGDIQLVGGTERQVVCSERWFQRGENKNFAFRINFENRAAAIADVKIPGFVEGEAGGDAHAFDPLHRAAIGRNAVNSSVVAAGNEKKTVAIDGEAGGIHHFRDEGLDGVGGSDFVKGDGNFLAALAAEGDVGVALGVDRGTGNGMQVIGDLRAERDWEWRAFGGSHFYAQRAAFSAFGNARDEERVTGEDQAAFGTAKFDERASVIARAESAAANGEFAAGKRGLRFHRVNFRGAVQRQL
jgi:hypothetical protein